MKIKRLTPSHKCSLDLVGLLGSLEVCLRVACLGAKWSVSWSYDDFLHRSRGWLLLREVHSEQHVAVVFRIIPFDRPTSEWTTESVRECSTGRGDVSNHV